MSQEDDKFIILLNKISEVSESTVRIETAQSYMKEDLEEVKRQDDIQNKLLAEHIQGVKTANERLSNEIAIRQQLETRVATLELTPKFFKSIYSIAVYLGAFVGLIYEAGRILHKW